MVTDEQIIEAVRSGTHTLVPMPVGRRKWYVGSYGNADIEKDAFVLILDLFSDEFEGEMMCGLMMGELVRCEGEWNIEDARSGKYGPPSDNPDDQIPF